VLKSYATAGVLGCLVVAVACGCARTTDGMPAQTVAAPGSTTTTTGSPATTATSESPTGTMPPYGVLETTRRPLTAGEVVCEPGPANTTEITGSAAGSPTVLMAIPEGFGPAPASGDAALTLSGPDGMTVTVSITPTDLDAAGAFERYADERTAGSAISSISLLPGDLCGYSGQEMMGTLAEDPGEAVEFADRIVHVWTDAGDFLLAVHLQGPSGL
jgi:hypothetical protein